LLRRQTDGDHHALKILHHIVIGESQHAISAGRKPLIASAIVAKTRFEIVALAIDFNDELAGMGDEVRNVVAHWALPAKSESSKPMCFQVSPQQGFGARHRAP
jgi:hypothetical protein